MTRSRTRARLAPVGPLALLIAFLAVALVGAGPAAAASGGWDLSPTSVDSEVLRDAPTAEEFAAAQTNLHDWLMTQLPAGVVERPVVVSLTPQEKRELASMQDAGGTPAVVG